MDSQLSTTEHPNLVEPDTITAPGIPQEIIDEILGHLATASDTRSLQSCVLVSRSWVPSCRKHIFHTTWFTPSSMSRWLEAFPVPEESPAHHIKDLRFWVGVETWPPEEFFERTPWFTNVQRVCLWESGVSPLSPTPSFWRFPPSITSLTISMDMATPLRIREILAELPNLDDLSLSGYFPTVPSVLGGEVPRTRAVMRGRFGGKLELLKGLAEEDVMKMLLEVPTGLHFTEIRIDGAGEWGLPATMKLLDACAKTLVKLSYVCNVYSRSDGHGSLQRQPVRSFDLSKFPNLQEVEFGARYFGGHLLCVHRTLSTLGPATSPNLSAIRLEFLRSLPINFGPMPGETGDGFPRLADELVRIEREFGGAVNLAVVLDPMFAVAPGTRNILQSWGESPPQLVFRWR